jgi:hypothetical protein
VRVGVWESRCQHTAQLAVSLSQDQ